MHQLGLFELDSDFKAAVEKAVAKLRLIAAKASTSLEGVSEKKAWLEEIEESLVGYKTICDVHTGVYFGNGIDELSYSTMVENRDFSLAGSIEQSDQYFHWELEFPEVFLDFRKTNNLLIIGNPPWGSELSEEQKEYLMSKYSLVHMRTPDTFNYFLAQAHQMCFDKTSSLVGMIVPNNFLFQHEFAKARKFFLTNASMRYVINLGDSVFEATAPSCVVIISFPKPSYDNYTMVSDLRYEKREMLPCILQKPDYSRIFTKEILDIPDQVIPMDKGSVYLLSKILRTANTTLGDISSHVSSGISTGGDKIFRLTVSQAKSHGIEGKILKPVLVGREFNEYYIPENTDSVLIYTTKHTNEKEIPNTLLYLLPYMAKLSKKRETVKGLIPWWNLHWPRNSELFESPKIILRQTSDTLIAAVDNNSFYCLNSVIIVRPQEGVSHYYLVGLLNSKLMRWVYKNLTQEQNRVFAEVKPINLRKLPIRLLDESIPSEVEIHERIINLALEATNLRGLNSTNEEDNNAEYARIIARLDVEVYKLYDFNQEEIDIIENAN